MKGALFLIVCVIGAAMGWLSGYDFDYRGGKVAFFFGLVVWIGVMAELIINQEAWSK